MCRQFGIDEGPDNTHSFADVFEDIQKSSALSCIIVDTWANRSNKYDTNQLQNLWRIDPSSF